MEPAPYSILASQKWSAKDYGFLPALARLTPLLLRQLSNSFSAAQVFSPN